MNRLAAHHVHALDVLRGVSIAAMILVNNPGDWSTVWPQLQHSAWDGCTLADLVFPAFLFIMGFAMPFAFERRLQQGHDPRHLHVRILRRALVLIALGLVLNAAAAGALTSIRIPGVLQRIAVVYLLAGFAVLHLKTRGRVVGIAALLLGHWALLMLPWGGRTAGALLPGVNVSAAIDRAVFGARHLLMPTGDPEGLLGTLPATATALLGVVAGHFVRVSTDPRRVLSGVALDAIGLVVLGLAWSAVLPFNKPLWTASYAVMTAGAALIAFALLYYTTDIRGWTGWTQPFVWLGVNPLVIYFASELFAHLLDTPIMRTASGIVALKTWLVWDAIEPALHVDGEVASFVYAVAYVLVWTSVAGVLYRARIRLHV
jgi:predicted acyltransferase